MQHARRKRERHTTIYSESVKRRDQLVKLVLGQTKRNIKIILKGKSLPQQAEVAQGVPGRLRPRIFLTFGTTRVVGRQPYAPAAFIPGTHF